jgi:DNA modification methylase
MTAFDSRELDALLLKPNPAEDDIPPTPEVPTTRLGDLWEMGGHRLLCGDATDAASVARTLIQDTPFLMVTDPPYGVNYKPGWRNEAFGEANRAVGVVLNDNRVDWSAAYRLFPGDVIYLWHAGLFAGPVSDTLTASGFQPRSQIIWAKQHFTISRGHYHGQHEPCWYAVRKGRKSLWHGDHSQSTLWTVNNGPSQKGGRPSDEQPTGHSTQKPVEIMRRPILNHTFPGDCVYDPFLGSGTTLIAAETTGRTCCGIELSPQYCDVIITRWQNLTDKQAVLADGPYKGATFEHVKEGRRREWEDQIGKEAFDAAE